MHRNAMQDNAIALIIHHHHKSATVALSHAACNRATGLARA
jgi:hypothetical protein